MKSFLQSDVWAEFQEKLGRKVFSVQGIKTIEHKIALNKSFLYAPRVEAINNFENFVKEIKNIAKKDNAIFFKLEFAHTEVLDGEFRQSNNIQPLQSIILDITKTEEELLSQMHPKTRYNITLAQKKGIEIKTGKDYFKEFWKLVEETSKRDGFIAYPREYYQKMLEIPGAELFVAEFPSTSLGISKIIAANIVLFCEGQAPTPTSSGAGQAIYLHGASDYEYRNLMAPYLLQWEQIKEAKKRNCVEYDFWGINEAKWPGVTRFKRGFGGQEITYPDAYDLIFRPFWYKVYKIAKKIL